MTVHKKNKISVAPLFSPLIFAAVLTTQVAQATTLAQAQQDCRDRIDAVNAAHNANAALRAQQRLDDFPDQVSHAIVPTAKSGGSGSNFSCYDLTQDAFKDVLSDAGSLFGDAGSLLTSIFGGAASSSASSLCGEAQQAVGNLFQKVTVKCPKISVPGMPISCNGSLGMTTSGIKYSGSGTLGGLSGSKSGTLDGSSGTFGGGALPAKAPSSGGLVSKFSCWLSNSCGN